MLLIVRRRAREASGRMIRRHPFGETPAGETVDLFTLRNGAGLEVSIMTYGATVQG